MKALLLACLFLCAAGNAANAQFKIGGKKINTQRLVNAGSDAAKAITLSDEDIASMSREYMQWMDAHNPVAPDSSELGRRIARLTGSLKGIDGLSLNIKVYEVVDVNAFACGDGSIRVCAGLMEVMTDDEVLAVIGHEIGHVKHADTKHAMKNAYLRSAAKNAVGAADGAVQKLTDSQLGALAEAFAGAQFSQKQENAADDHAFEFCLANGVDPYAMSKALGKLVEMSKAGGEKASRIKQMFSTHPDSEKRAARMKEKADEYVKSHS